MEDHKKSKAQLINELNRLRQQFADRERHSADFSSSDRMTGNFSKNRMPEFIGREVSCRALGITFQELQRRGQPLEIVLDGVPYSLEYLRDKHNRIDWESYRRLSANLGQLLNDEELVALGGAFMRSPWAKPIALVGQLFYTAHEFYRWTTEPGLSSNRDFTCLETSSQSLGANRLSITVKMQPGYEPCAEYFLVVKGVLISMPVLLGLKEAGVEMEPLEAGARYVIDLPAGGGMLSWLRRVVTWPFTVWAAAQELRQSYEVLQRRYLELEQQITERRRAEQALRESEVKYRSLVDQASDGIFVTDPDGNFIDVNSKGCLMLGYSRSEILSMHIKDLITEEDLTARPLTLDDLETGEAVLVERQLKRKDGSKIEVEISGKMLPDGNSHGIVRDITERKQMEQAIKASEARYRTLVEAADDVILLTDLKGNHLFRNSAYYRSLGFVPNEAVNLDGYDRVHPDDIPRLKANMPILLEQGIFTGEYRVQHKDGHWVHRSAKTVALYNDENQPQTFLSIIRDITEQKQVEAALRESEETARALLNAFPDSALLTDSAGVIIALNDIVAKQLGKTPAELIGGSSLKYLPPNLARVRKTWEDEVIRTREPVHFEDNQAGRWLDCHIQPIFDAAGQVTRLAIFARDITEHKHAEKKLLEYSERLEDMVQIRTTELQLVHERLIRQEKLATIGQMSASIAHELRNPLGAVKQSGFYLQRLHKRANLNMTNPKVKEHLDLIEREINIADRVISDLLEMTRIKSPQQELVDLQSVIQATTERGILPDHIQLTVNCRPDPFLIWADPVQLQQVLSNLLTNAAQACSDRGHVSIIVHQLSEQEQAEIIIQDNGRGIEPTVIDKIFEPLYTTRAKGTGLGLSICKQIIEAHGGTISLSSQVNQGTSAQIILPMAQVLTMNRQ